MLHTTCDDTTYYVDAPRTVCLILVQEEFLPAAGVLSAVARLVEQCPSLLVEQQPLVRVGRDDAQGRTTSLASRICPEIRRNFRPILFEEMLREPDRKIGLAGIRPRRAGPVLLFGKVVENAVRAVDPTHTVRVDERHAEIIQNLWGR